MALRRRLVMEDVRTPFLPMMASYDMQRETVSVVYKIHCAKILTKPKSVTRIYREIR